MPVNDVIYREGQAILGSNGFDSFLTIMFDESEMEK